MKTQDVDVNRSRALAMGVPLVAGLAKASETGGLGVMPMAYAGNGNIISTTAFAASYDAWGKPTVTADDILFPRGFGGHEMLTRYRLANMDGRLYDYELGRFLSPDNYVQEPGNGQSYNRYSYCLNNPLKYTDPTGEAWQFLFGGLIGGIANLVANIGNCDGVWQYLAAFVSGAGAGAGAAIVATGGTGAGALSVTGVGAVTGAVTSATNSVIAQTGKNFEGMENVNWEFVGESAFIGGMAGGASGAAGYYMSGSSLLVNNVNSPVLRSAIVSPLAAGAGHVAGGVAAGLVEGYGLEYSFLYSFHDIEKSMMIGGALGVASTIGACYAKGINPWTGISPHTSTVRITFGNNENQRYHTFRHTDLMSLDQEVVKNAVSTDILQLKQIPVGQHRIITIGEFKLQYTVYRLNDGTLNVGRIHGVK